jgi:hypothetical protein
MRKLEDFTDQEKIEMFDELYSLSQEHTAFIMSDESVEDTAHDTDHLYKQMVWDYLDVDYEEVYKKFG